MPQGRKKSAVDIFEQEQRRQTTRRPSAVDIFEQEQAAPQVPTTPLGPAPGVLENLKIGAQRTLLSAADAGRVMEEALGAATKGDFGPLKQVGELVGRGAISLGSGLGAGPYGAGQAYVQSQVEQAPRIAQIHQEQQARMAQNPELYSQEAIAERQRLDALAAQDPSLLGKITRGVSEAVTSAIPAVVTGLATGGSVPAVAGMVGLQSMAQPENLPLNVALAAAPIPVGRVVAPIIRRIRGNKVGLIQPEVIGAAPNPEGLALAIGQDAFDTGKVKVADLGLESVAQPTRSASARPITRQVSPDDITLSRDELSKGRMFQVEEALQGGVKQEGETFTTMGGGKRRVEPIVVQPDPKNPSKFIIEDDGNHRVALLKLQGQNEPIPVKSFETPAQSKAIDAEAPELPTYNPVTNMPELEYAPPKPFGVSVGTENAPVPGAVGPRINEYGVVERMASEGGSAREVLGPKTQANFALEDGTAVAPAEKTGVRDTLISLYKAGLLTRPTTHLRNIIGTGLFQISEEAARIPAAIADIVASAVTNRRTISGPSLTAFGRSAYEAATNGIEQAKQILKSGVSAEDLASGELLKEINSGSKILDSYVNGVFRLLKAEDKVFRVYAYRRALEDRARSLALTEIRQGAIPKSQFGSRVRELIETKPTDLQAAALADAEIATFNNQNIVNRGVTAFKQGVENYPGGKLLNFSIDTAAPFTKTPTNVIARTLDYSPIGLGNSAYKVAKGIATQTFTAEEQRAFAQTFGRGTIGTGLLVLGWKLYDAGLMTGLYEDEPSKRTRDQAAGRIPGAIRIGDTWHQVTSFSPLGNLMAVGASLAREFEEERQNQAQRIPAILGVLQSAAEEQPLLQASKNLTQRQGGDISERLGGLAGSAVPGIVSDVGELIDQSQRQASGQGFAAQIEKRLPFAREALPVATDALGRPLEDRATQAIDPTRSTTASELPILKEMVRLDVGLAKLKKTPGETDNAYRTKVSRFGLLYRQYGADLLQNPQYQSASDKLKEKALESLSNRTRVQVFEETKDSRRAGPAEARLNSNLIMSSVLYNARIREKP